MTKDGLVYVGKIVRIEPIEGADFIESATVVCGHGGRWKGIIQKGSVQNHDLCMVYLPDSLIKPSEALKFMERHKWRVRMCRFKGAPSEVLITLLANEYSKHNVGYDLTVETGTIKYIKPVPAHLQGAAKGNFPEFIPKTDELNYQRNRDLVDALTGKWFYITEKADGSSTTAFRYQGEFGVCSRNFELQRNENNGYWQVAIKYKLEEKLPEGIALQWETCGPGIQGNPMRLQEIDGFAFSAYKIDEHRYLEMMEFVSLVDNIGFPRCKMIDLGVSFDPTEIEKLGEGLYDSGNQREGVVVRSQENYGHKPISFKVINLNYE